MRAAELLPAKGEPSPDEGLLLTRLVLGFCLGKGSLSRYARTVNLQITHPQSAGDYANYQWRRLLQVLPTAKPPVLHRPPTGRPSWRIRVGSRFFTPAFNMLYGSGELEVSRDVLSLLGAEAIATLWADRGQVKQSRETRKRPSVLRGELPLFPCDLTTAAVVSGWIAALTGVQSTVAPPMRDFTAPLLQFDEANLRLLLGALERTWHAQAPCLAAKFKPPRRPAPGSAAAAGRPSVATGPGPRPGGG